MAPKWHPKVSLGPIFGPLFARPSFWRPKPEKWTNIGYPILEPFRQLFVKKSILASFLGVPEACVFLGGVLERPGLQNDAKKVPKNDSKTYFFSKWKTAIGYGIYCTEATWGRPGRVPKTFPKTSLEKTSKKCLRGSFLGSILGAIWDHFGHIFAFWAKKRQKNGMQKKHSKCHAFLEAHRSCKNCGNCENCENGGGQPLLNIKRLTI